MAGEPDAFSASLPVVDVWVYNYKTGEILYKKSKSVHNVLKQHEDEIEPEWKPTLYNAEESIEKGKIEEAKEKLHIIPKESKAWKLVGDELLKKAEKKTIGTIEWFIDNCPFLFF